jgi:peptidoglycan hydrolase-like protein with peptidoglycan-binding domain
MGQRSRARVRNVVENGPRGISPGAAALGVLALGLSGMILWNAFYGVHQGRSRDANRTVVPPGATTRVVVEAPTKPANTITISYSGRVEDVQRELSATGHFRGLVDGVMGKQTALAIRKYQAGNGLAETGEVSKALLDHIRLSRKAVANSDFTGSLPKAAPTRTQTREKKLPVSVKPETKPNGLVAVREAQRRLKGLRYEISVVNGVSDDQLRAAVLKFQMDYGLSMDGAVSRELLSALKVAEAGQSASTQ